MNRLPIILVLVVLSACQYSETPDAMPTDHRPQPYVKLEHPEWTRKATIYEVNVRQYTPEGTFAAFAEHLPRLKEMGVDILWLMPIHPIGEKNRKGSLGSYYSVQDYYGVNPEFGSEEDFRSLVDRIHEMGMYVILDWVANHSAWDHPLVEEHPEWYTRSREGDFQPTPWYDWGDIIDFDYDQSGIRAYMSEAMKYWVEEFDVDGFRCDVAGFIPIDFWEKVRRQLEAIKPVFMLAEWESRDLHERAFDMTYAWSLWDKMHAVTTKGAPIHGLVEYLAHHVNTFPADGYRMTFTDNHDKNSWEGNVFSNFGEGLEACMVLCGTVAGMPLVYSGQEAGLDRSLAFFEKDTIQWRAHRHAELYRQLFALKHANEALWNGKAGGGMIRVENDRPEQIISFFREKNRDRVLAVFNFSATPQTVRLTTAPFVGSYTELFSGEAYELVGNDSMELEAWGYRVLVGNK